LSITLLKGAKEFGLELPVAS